MPPNVNLQARSVELAPSPVRLHVTCYGPVWSAGPSRRRLRKGHHLSRRTSNSLRPVSVRYSATNCYGCHGPEKQFNSLRLDSRAAMMQGGKRGPVLVSGKPEDSLLIQAVRHQGLKMPLGGRLEESQIAALEEWIRRGAPWPASPAIAAGNEQYKKLAREHWAFQAVKKPPLPRVAEAKWSLGPVDSFVYRALEEGRPLSRRASRPPHSDPAPELRFDWPAAYRGRKRSLRRRQLTRRVPGASGPPAGFAAFR